MSGQKDVTNGGRLAEDPSWREVSAELEPHVEDSAETDALTGVCGALRDYACDAEPPNGWDAVRAAIDTVTMVPPVGRGRAVRLLAACLALSTIVSLYYAVEARWEANRLRRCLVQREDVHSSTFTADEAVESLTVFREAASYYDGQAAWVALTGTRVHLGLSPAAIRAVGPSGAVVVRISLADGPSHPDLTTDVVAHLGVTSAFRNIVGDELAITYEITPLAVDGDGALVRVHIAASSSSVQPRAEMSEVMGTLRVRRGERQALGVVETGAGLRNVTVAVQWQETVGGSGERA